VNETLYADLPFGTWYYLLALGLRLPQCLWNNFKPEARPKLRPERDQIYARSEPKFTPEANPRPRVLPPEQFRKPMLDCFDCLFGSNQSSFCAFMQKNARKTGCRIKPYWTNNSLLHTFYFFSST
jgi:hypothetical protein